MTQKKQTKKIKVPDLKPRKDAKGGTHTHERQHPHESGHHRRQASLNFRQR